MPYVQPPLAPGKLAADWLWLAVHRATVPPETDEIPSERIAGFLEAFIRGLGLAPREDERFKEMFRFLNDHATISLRHLATGREI